MIFKHFLRNDFKFNRIWICVFLWALSACSENFNNLKDVGRQHELSPIGKYSHLPYLGSSLPMKHEKDKKSQNHNSLWRLDSRAFLGDQRAHKVGDILTILITISDQAKLSTNMSSERDNKRKLGLGSLFGLENRVGSLSDLFRLDTKKSLKGKGALNRDEKIQLKLAGVIVQSLPNGNLVIQARQEIRVNSETREVMVIGVVRSEDITSSNTISSEKIAEARIMYGGQGTLSRGQKPRWGEQFIDAVYPF